MQAMKKIRLIVAGLLTAYCLLFTDDARAATGCTYPTSLDTFTDRIAGDFLTIALLNQMNCGIEKIMAELGVAPSGGYATVVARLNDTALLPGNAGGQILRGGTGSGESLTLQSTSHATKGGICLGLVSCFDETAVRLGIGVTAPSADLHIRKNASVLAQLQVAGTAQIPGFLGISSAGTFSSPTATQSGDPLVQLMGVGYGATVFSGTVGWAAIKARENFTDTAQGTYFEFTVAPVGTNTPAVEMLLDTAGLRVGDGNFAETAFHAGLISNVAAFTFEESTATPINPADGAQVRMYMKANKIVFVYNDGGTTRYKYLDLTGTGVTWVADTSAP